MQPKTSGLLIPLFSMKREHDHGIGDTAALIEWIDWAFDHGVGFLQLLPVNALGSDPDPSPYSAISSVALEPVYLTLEPDWVPGIKTPIVDTPLEHQPLLSPNSPDLVDYPLVRSWKLGKLKKAFSRFSSEIEFTEQRKEFSQWVEAQDNWLADFVDYKVAAQHFGTDIWWQWEEQDIETIRALAAKKMDKRVFEEWLQWLCAEQWERVRAHADSRKIKLMGDIPIGLSMASSDVFFERDIFDIEWSGGAPAEGDFADDPFTAKWGQNWGIPLYKWDVMARKDNFAWWRRRIRHAIRIFQMYRIDHILGFYRIFAFPWKPTENNEFLPLNYEEAAAKTGGRLPQFLPRPDWSNEDKQANLHNGDKYLRILLEEGIGVDVVGEDLGCVPDYVRPHMRMLNIPGFKIPHWEIMENGEILKGENYHECSFATYATHDFPPIAVTWDEIYQRVEEGRVAEQENIADENNPALSYEERQHRKSTRQGKIETMANSLHSLYWFADYCNFPRTSAEVPWNAMCKTALFHALFSSNSRFVALMYTDLFDIRMRLNTPGTIGGLNWRPRTPFTAPEAYALMPSLWIKRLILQTSRTGTIMMAPMKALSRM